LVVLGFGTGCGSSPALGPENPPREPPAFAPAVTITDNLRIPTSLVVFVPCAAGGVGEVITVSGDLHILTHLTINDNNFTLKSHFQPQGISGSGATTGAKYQATGVTQSTQTGSFTNARFEFTFVNNFRMIGQGPGNNFLVHQNVHVTVNANGVVTATHDNFSFDCK
jgi:hypothetical protein